MQRNYETKVYNCGFCHRQAISERGLILPSGWWSVRFQSSGEGMKQRGNFCGLHCLVSGMVRELRRRSRPPT